MIIDKTEFTVSAEDILQELRSQLILNHIELLKIEPRESGNNIQIQCPYHGNGQERKPSAGIRKSDGIFHCFACGETHSLPEVVSYCFGYNDNGAFGWQWLLKNFLTISIEERKGIELDFVRTRGDSGFIEGDKRFVEEEELDRYRWTHPYWAKRGIIEDWVIDLFDLGYDREKQMITMPVRDVQGRCEFVAKRSVKTKFFQYPEGVSKPLYGLYELNVAGMSYSANGRGSAKKAPLFKDVFICESMIDCILLWQSGHYAVALNGLGNDRQFKQLRNLPCRHLILATDNDEAGQKARMRIKKNVTNKLFSEINFPEDIKDIGECSREQIDSIRDWERWGFER